MTARDKRVEGTAVPRLTTEDKLEILDLAGRYWIAVDTWDVDGYVELFTEDGVYELPDGPREGREAIRQWLLGYKPVRDGNRHHTLNPVITDNGDGTASMRSYMLVVAAEREGSRDPQPHVSAHGYFTDHLVRIDGAGWRFASRKLEGAVARPSDLPRGREDEA